MLARLPLIENSLASQICQFMQKVREMDFFKRPGVAETLDWASALLALGRDHLDKQTVDETLGCIFKYNEDVQRARGGELDGVLEDLGCLPIVAWEDDSP